MNLYKRMMYKNSLQHGQKWRDHKYLYIDENGRYVYPEDVKNKAVNNIRTYKNAAGMMLNDGQQNEINRRKERSERVKAGNANMRKGINVENAKKVGKALLSPKSRMMAIAGKDISKVAAEKKAAYKEREKQREAELNREAQKSLEEANAEMKKGAVETTKAMAKDEGMQRVGKAVGKELTKELGNEWEDGYYIKPDGFVYDNIGAIVRKATPEDYEKRDNKKKKVAKR